MTESGIPDGPPSGTSGNSTSNLPQETGMAQELQELREANKRLQDLVETLSATGRGNAGETRQGEETSEALIGPKYANPPSNFSDRDWLNYAYPIPPKIRDVHDKNKYIPIYSLTHAVLRDLNQNPNILGEAKDMIKERSKEGGDWTYTVSLAKHEVSEKDMLFPEWQEGWRRYFLVMEAPSPDKQHYAWHPDTVSLWKEHFRSCSTHMDATTDFRSILTFDCQVRRAFFSDGSRPGPQSWDLYPSIKASFQKADLANETAEIRQQMRRLNDHIGISNYGPQTPTCVRNREVSQRYSPYGQRPELKPVELLGSPSRSSRTHPFRGSNGGEAFSDRCFSCGKEGHQLRQCESPGSTAK